MSDGQLLKEFIADGDEEAFAALVQRHGPMVMGVCQRVLAEPHDAEDAFQATFLILARKAASVGDPSLLGNWLYGVAHRTALEARSKIMRRHAKERQSGEEPSVEPTPDVVWREVRVVLDEEVRRLPDKFRIPFVLCYLEGQTNDDAASRLRCPPGTIRSRLATARERLRARLVHRGIALSVGSLALVLGGRTSAAVPDSLAGSTTQAAVQLAAGQPLSAVATGQVATLMEGVLRTMFFTKLKIAAASVSAAVLLTLGAAAILGQAGKPDQGDADNQKLAGVWKALEVTDNGQVFANRGVEKTSFAFEGDKLIAHMSDDGIREDRDDFAFELDPNKKPKTIALTKANGNRWLGIYSLEDNNLKICLAHRTANKPPSEFTAKKGSRATLFVLQREKQ